MKYIPADKLITILEERRAQKDNLYERYGDPVDSVRADELTEVIDIISSLQQEQPDNEDIDKVAQELYEHLYELKRRNNVPTNLYDKQEIIDLWKAGIEYGRNHPKQEPSEVDLEKEIDAVWNPRFNLGWDEHSALSMNHAGFASIARHFWNKGYNARKEE